MVWGQISKTVEALLMVAIAVAAVRALNPNAFGLYSLLTYLAGAASVMVPLAMVESVGAVLPRFRDARERVSLMLLLTGLRVAIIVVGVLLLLPGWTVIRDLFGLDAISYRVFLVGALYWFAQDLLNSLSSFYLVELDLRPVALWKPLGQLVTLAGIVLVAATEDRWASSVGEVLAAVTLGYLVSAAGLTLGLRKWGRPRLPERVNVRTLLGFTRHTWWIGVLTFLLTMPLNVLLIGALTEDTRDAAFYVLAVGVVGRAQLLLIAGWSSLLIPASAEALLHGGMGGLARAWRLFSDLWLLIALPVNAILLAVSEPLVEAMFGAAYAEAGELLLWVAAFNILAAFLLSPPSVAALWALDRQRSIARVRSVTALANVALAVVLILAYGALGAVFATGASTVITSLVELRLARRAIVPRFPARVAILTSVAAAAAVVPALALRGFGGLGVAAAIALGAATYLVVLAVLRPLDGEHLDVLARIHTRLDSPWLRRLARAEGAR